MCYSILGILALGANDPDPDIGTPFDKACCLQWLSSPLYEELEVYHGHWLFIQ